MLLYTALMPEDRDKQKFILSMYEKYKYVMFKTAGKYESDSDSVDDLIQEVLVSLIEKVTTLMELDDLALVAYIVYTIRNTATDRFRRRQTSEKYIGTQELTEEMVASVQSQTGRSLEDEVLHSLEASQLKNILKLLPDRTQLLLRGKYQLSLDDAELARILGCRPGSIRMMLTRARRQALELLEKEGFNEIT